LFILEAKDSGIIYFGKSSIGLQTNMNLFSKNAAFPVQPN
jgi:hypothetical protein